MCFASRGCFSERGGTTHDPTFDQVSRYNHRHTSARSAVCQRSLPHRIKRPLVRTEIGSGVKRAAVVPHQDVAHSPYVLVRTGAGRGDRKKSTGALLSSSSMSSLGTVVSRLIWRLAIVTVPAPDRVRVGRNMLATLVAALVSSGVVIAGIECATAFDPRSRFCTRARVSRAA
jgi:hypothetical protein